MGFLICVDLCQQLIPIPFCCYWRFRFDFFVQARVGLDVRPVYEYSRRGQRSRAVRRANVSGAYALAERLELSGKRVVLVDDVATSGATLSECAFLLRQAGAESVTGLTLARAR